MIRLLIIAMLMLLSSQAMASNWYISENSPFTDDDISGTECRYLVVNSSDALNSYSPAIDTSNINNAEFKFDKNKNSAGTGADVTIYTCSNGTDTGTCSVLQGDIDEDGVNENLALTFDEDFIAPTQLFIRGRVATAATGNAKTVLKMCGSTSILPLREVDPVFGGVDTEAELEAHLGGLNIYTANDGALGSHADGTNCPSGQYPLGVDASGNVQGCTADAIGADNLGDHIATQDIDLDGNNLISVGSIVATAGLWGEYACEDYAGADIGAKCNAAYADAIADGQPGVTLKIGSGSFTQTTTIDVCDETGQNNYIPAILKGANAGLGGASGTLLTAGSGFTSTAIAKTSYTVIVDQVMDDGATRDIIQCVGCDFVAAGITRGDLIETSGFASSANNYIYSNAQMPLKVYRVDQTELVLEAEASTNPSMVAVGPTATGDVRRLKAQVEICHTGDWVENISFNATSSAYSDIAVWARPDNATNRACIGAGDPYAQCTGVGTGSLSVAISTQSGVDRIEARSQLYGGVWLTAPEVGGQSDHFQVLRSNLLFQLVGAYYDGLQAQPGMLIADSQLTGFKRNGARSMSGSMILERNTIISADADCLAGNFGDGWHVEMGWTNTVGISIHHNNIETKCGGSIKVASGSTVPRRVQISDNIISTNYSTPGPFSMVSVADMCGTLDHSNNHYTNNAGPTVSAATIDIGNSNQDTCPLNVMGVSSYRDAGPAGPDPVLIVSNGVETNSFETGVWRVSTADELESAFAACEAYAGTSSENTGGRIIIDDWITRNCATDSMSAGACFEASAVAQPSISDRLDAACVIEFASVSDSIATSVDGSATTTGIECDNTGSMTGETIGGQTVKACLAVSGDGQQIKNPTIVTSDGSDASTVGIMVRSKISATTAVRSFYMENASIRNEDVTSSGTGLGLSFVLGGEIGINNISGFSGAGVDLFDIGSIGANNNINFHGPGGIRNTGVGIKCDSAYDSQQFSVSDLVLESDGVAILADTNCTALITVRSAYIEGEQDGSPAYPATSGIEINSPDVTLDFEGIIVGEYDTVVSGSDRGIYRTAEPTNGFDDRVSVRYQTGVSSTYPAAGGIIENGSYARSKYGFQPPASASLPVSCSGSQMWIDNDATSGQRIYLCESGTFVLQGDGGGASADDLGNHTATIDINLADHDIDQVKSEYFNEKSAPNIDIAGDGQLWVYSDATNHPNVLMFTSDDNSQDDFRISGDRTFYVENYGFDTGNVATHRDALVAAIAACETDDSSGESGGIVHLPRGELYINAASHCGGVCTSPIVEFSETLSGSNEFASCVLAGYGSTAPGQTFSAPAAGSTIRIANYDDMIADASGDRVAIQIKSSGQLFRDFNLHIEENAGTAVTSQLYAVLADSENQPTQSTSWLKFENVTILGPANTAAAGEAGIGIGLRYAKQSHFLGTTVVGFDEGVTIEDTSGIASNNAISFNDSYIGQNDTVGMRIGANEACRDLSFFGGVIEGSNIGLIIDATSTCYPAFYGTHFENGVTNVQINSDSSVYKSFGANYNPTSPAQGQDIDRTIAQAAGVGADIIISPRLENGIDYSVSGAKAILIEPVLQTTANLGGSNITSLTWDQWVSAGDATWTGNHDFSGGDVDLPAASVDIADVNATGTASSTTYLRGDGTWNTPPGGIVNSFETLTTPSGTSPVADASNDTLTFFTGTGLTITGSSAADTIAFALDADLIDLADGTLTGSKVGSGILPTNITGAGSIPAAVVGAGHIDALTEIAGALCTDGQILKNSGGTSWTCAADVSGGAGNWTDSTGEVHPTTTTNDVCNDSTCSNWRIQDTGEAQFTSVTTDRTATPRITLGDSDTTDPDDNVVLQGNCTDTGSGTEDCDALLRVQVAGTETTAIAVDADGGVTITSPTATGNAALVLPAASVGSAELGSEVTIDTEATEYCQSGGIDSPDNSDRLVPGHNFAVTITRLECYGPGGGSITLGLDECSSTGGTCANGGISVTCDGTVDAGNIDTSFTDAAFDANDYWQLNFGTVSGTVNYASWTICYDRQVVQ